MFSYDHRVQFYETDLMGIVHHANYLRFFEEARVAWAHAHGLIDYQKPETGSHFAVLETNCRHVRPSFFGDVLKIEVEVRSKGVRIFFQYRIWNEKKEIVALGQSFHAPLDKNLKPMRMSQEMKKILENQSWTETWL